MSDTGLLYDVLSMISELKVICDMILHRLVNTAVLEDVSTSVFEDGVFI
jgi:hypothetical protein